MEKVCLDLHCLAWDWNERVGSHCMRYTLGPLLQTSLSEWRWGIDEQIQSAKENPRRRPNVNVQTKHVSLVETSQRVISPACVEVKRNARRTHCEPRPGDPSEDVNLRWRWGRDRDDGVTSD